jgi:hypothetical protein
MKWFENFLSTDSEEQKPTVPHKPDYPQVKLTKEDIEKEKKEIFDFKIKVAKDEIIEKIKMFSNSRCYQRLGDKPHYISIFFLVDDRETRIALQGDLVIECIFCSHDISIWTGSMRDGLSVWLKEKGYEQKSNV